MNYNRAKFIDFFRLFTFIFEFYERNIIIFYSTSLEKNRIIYFFLFLINRKFLIIRTLIIIVTIILKLGSAPLHFWYILIIQKLSWQRIWVLSIWQKILPLLFLRLYGLPYLIYLGLLNCILRRLLRFKQKKVKKLLGFSSIFTLGWVLTVLSSSGILWFTFLIGYGINLIFLTYILNIKDGFKVKILISELDINRFIILGLTLIAIRGVPPFLGFFLKLLVLKVLITNFFLIRLIITISSLLLIYAYLNLIFHNLRFSRRKQLLNSRFFNLHTVNLIIVNSLSRLLIWELIY